MTFPNAKRPAAYDIQGDLSKIPTGYLIGVIRKGRSTVELTTRIAAEFDRRQVVLGGYIQARIKGIIGGTCSVDGCERRGIYQVNIDLFCRRHREQAIARRVAVRDHRESFGKDAEEHRREVEQRQKRRDQARWIQKRRNGR